MYYGVSMPPVQLFNFVESHAAALVMSDMDQIVIRNFITDYQCLRNYLALPVLLVFNSLHLNCVLFRTKIQPYLVYKLDR
jgi:hypothetical protein